MARKENTEVMLYKMVLVATLYYKEKLSQQEIAKRLDISRPWVSKLLARAEEMGIVKIEINSPVSGNLELEERLKRKYGLKYAGVVDGKDETKDYVALAAVHHFVSIVRPGDVVGVGWGNAVSRFIKEMIPMHQPDTQTVPLAGSFGVTFETLPNYNAIEMANKLGGRANVLHVPAFCLTKEEYDALMTNQHTADILDLAEHVDIAVVGVGTLESSFLAKHKILSEEEMEQLQDAGTIGDVILQFRDRHGDIVRTEATERMIRADIMKVKQHARSVIGVAAGEEKVEMLNVILPLQLIDAFFTDEKTALELLKK